MFKNLIKSFAAGLLLVSPVLAADADGVFKGTNAQGRVLLQLQTDQSGYLIGKLNCNHGVFVVIARQQGDHLVGIFEVPGVPPTQFTGLIQDDATLLATCNGATISLKRNQADAKKADANLTASTPDNGDSVSADLKAMADQAAHERRARLARIYASQNNQPAAIPQPYSATDGVYGQTPSQQTPAQGNQAVYGNYPTTGSYQAQPNQAAPANGYTPGYTPAYAPAYTPTYSPTIAQEPVASLNQPNDGSAQMQQYQQYEAAQDQIALQRSDTMREQNRYVGQDGQQYTAPENATQVTVDQAGQATYTTAQAPEAPANETVAQPYSYSAPAATEGDGN